MEPIKDFTITEKIGRLVGNEFIEREELKEETRLALEKTWYEEALKAIGKEVK